MNPAPQRVYVPDSPQDESRKGAEGESKASGPGTEAGENKRECPKIRGSVPLIVFAAAMLGMSGVQAAEPVSTNQTVNFIYSPISLADAINLALKQNQAILRAQKDVEAAAGVVIQTKAIALPKVGITGEYGRCRRATLTRRLSSRFDLRPPRGGRHRSSWCNPSMRGAHGFGFSHARLTRERSLLDYQTVVVDVVLLVKVAYYDVLLAQQQIVVQEASVELLSRELADTTRRFEAGRCPASMC